MGLPDSHGVSRDPHYLGTHSRKSERFSLTGLSPSMVTLIQRGSAKCQICNFPRVRQNPENVSHNPICTTAAAYHVHMVWAFPVSLAATNGVEIFFSFLEVLRCFSSLGWLRTPMYSVCDYLGLPSRVSPFGNPRVACFQQTVAYRR